ncbi:di-heme-cytochrome C peroxidase [Poseidonocella sp. HB161398]|uniref:di-heme-cytochrome C peroxidase n=1 Tax=Poseidonocella sp. HB161398 TaxID=2320855 RepID=UPI001108328C|nr:di-heme-cytochrome C peroxidase [Poseidonocella sp. HB161398]
MKFSALATLMSISCMPAAAEEFAANDVSILLEAPFEAEDPKLLLPVSSLSRELADVIARTISEQADGQEGTTRMPKIRTALLEASNRDRLHVASIRIDPGAPGLHSAFAPFGRNLQVRLVVQPVDVDKPQPVTDEALHLVYQFGARDASVPGCGFRVVPSEADISAYEAVLTDLAAMKRGLAAMDVDTTGQPLGVHPAFGSPGKGHVLVEKLAAFLETHLTEDRLSAVSIAGLPDGAPEPWVFLAMQVAGPQTVIAVPSPALPGRPVGGPPPQANTRQMLSFVGDRSKRVFPAPLTRNLAPVDCLFNQAIWAHDLPRPGPGDGVSTAELFAPGGNMPDRAAEIGAVIADTSRSHFFNTDCVSCHTETRRQMDAGPDPMAAGAEIAAAEGIAAADLPADPGGRLDHWNIRAFGWFPGFGQTGERAHATVVRRTARETADVLACLNDGDWKDLSQSCGAPAPVKIDAQGWTDEVRRAFYHTSQGGRILPAAWFNALETPEGGARFATRENLETYGLLASEQDEWNPDGWPIGFARTSVNGTDYVSLNCAACHTADVVAGDVRSRVDGAPAAFDFDRFIGDLARAVAATVQMDFSEGSAPVPRERFQRFLATIALETPELKTDPDKAMGRILAETSAFAGNMALRRPAHPSGPGRVDALTQITNVLVVSDLGMPSNFAVPQAPTSYPPLWLTPGLEYVQYNLSVADPLSRNLGQALGVFGTVNLSGKDMFTSSADIDALQDYERWLEMLDVPAWPEAELGPIDEELGQKGKDLFAANCERCHNAPNYRKTDAGRNAKEDTFIEVSHHAMEEAGTDPAYIAAFTRRWALSGPLDGVEIGGTRIPPVEPAALLLSQIVGATVRQAVGDRADELLRLRPAGQGFCQEKQDTQPCGYMPPGGGSMLKAAPLEGVWATGPYLHNGSVRTIYQLLSPPGDRETTFFVGDRRLDADEMGFLSTASDGAYEFDTSLPGNGNGGHVFWDKPFSDPEKRALIEYLKEPARFPFIRPDGN